MSDWFNAEYLAEMEADYQRIRDKYPALVTHNFECMMGWFGIIEAYFDEVARILSANPDAGYGLLQVKEKFGGLRIYDYASPHAREEIEAANDRAVQAAFKTCDVCGQPGVLRQRVHGAVMATRCEEHAERGEPIK